MEPIKPPKTFKIYTLIKQTGAAFTYTSGSASSSQLGLGFFTNLQEAEHIRTVEVLKDNSTGSTKSKFHIFELEVPNPIYEEQQ
jgi:hypothetical protein